MNNKTTLISTDLIQSEDLSFDEVGFLGFLLSFPPDWQFYVSDIAKRKSVSKDKIYSLFQKLESKGYVRRQRVRNKNGTLGASIIEFNEKPFWWKQEAS